jgi:hypothetical protein
MLALQDWKELRGVKMLVLNRSMASSLHTRYNQKSTY